MDSPSSSSISSTSSSEATLTNITQPSRRSSIVQQHQQQRRPSTLSPPLANIASEDEEEEEDIEEQILTELVKSNLSVAEEPKQQQQQQLYSNTFDSTSSFLTPRKNEEEYEEDEEDDEDWSSPAKLQKLKRVDFAKYVNIRMKLLNNQVTVRTHSRQIDKLLSRIKLNRTTNEDDRALPSHYEHLLNRLKTRHEFLHCDLKQARLEKVNELGADLVPDRSTELARVHCKRVHERLYYALKCERVRSRATDLHYEQVHRYEYEYGLALIAQLARNLPKASDPPEKLWQELLKPLNKDD